MKNLKPFDLQTALAGKAVILRNGDKAYVRHHETEIDVDDNLQLQGVTEGGTLRAWDVQGLILPRETEVTWDIVGMYPETRFINGFEVPAPETSAPERNRYIYIPNVTLKAMYFIVRWDDNEIAERLLKRGLVFLNVEDAIAAAKAMVGVDPHCWGEDSYDIIGMYPEVRIINGFKVPAPEVHAPERGEVYYTACPISKDFHLMYSWDGRLFDSPLLKRGLVFLNKEDAIATAKAMLGIDPYAKAKSHG